MSVTPAAPPTIVAEYDALEARFAPGVSVAFRPAASKATVAVTGLPPADRVKLVSVTLVTGSLNVATIALLAGKFTSPFAGTVETTFGAMVSIAPLRLMSTGDLFKGVVTGKVTRADLVPFTA